METSRNNKWLTVLPNVVLTPEIDPVIAGLDKYFEEAGTKGVVTSGFRSAEHQLSLIVQYLTIKNLISKYPSATKWKLEDKNEDGTYTWQLGWSNLLNLGIIINPPIKATVLMDYIHPVTKVNLKGKTINSSPHSLGLAFDIGGVKAVAIIQRALRDKLPGLVSYLVERENNAIHINTTPIIKK